MLVAVFLFSCTVSKGTDSSLSESIEVKRAKAEAFERRLWNEHRGFPTFSTSTLPKKDLRDVFRAFAALMPDGAYVIGDQTRFVIKYDYENTRRLGNLRNASYEVEWKERSNGRVLFVGQAEAVCQFSDALIAYPPDCEDMKPALLLSALSELR